MLIELTNNQIKELVDSSDEYFVWHKVDYWQRVVLLHRLNKELKRQGLPQVTEEIHHWRMAQALPLEVKKKSAQKTNSQQSSTGRSTQEGSTKISDVLNVISTSLYDLDESNATQHLAA